EDKMAELKNRFPPGVDYSIVYNTAPFIQESINEVYKTLFDAVLLVAFVVLLFLQNWRSAIIPLFAVPVAIVGTFVLMKAANFSLNNLTLFGLVLAIGIVVDDAIVVVEAVEHHMEHGKSPREATILAMSQVSGPVVAVALVLTAVFVPCAFITGITGQFFRQFALTIAVSTLISAFNSLTLSPALSALLLRSHHGTKGGGWDKVILWIGFLLIGAGLGYRLLSTALAPWVEQVLGHFTRNPTYEQASLAAGLAGLVIGLIAGMIVGTPWALRAVNVGFERATGGYARAVGGLLRVSVLVLVVYGGLLFMTYWSFTETPSGFIPEQDKGYLLVNVQLPDAASVGRTQRIMERLEQIALKDKGVDHTVAIAGQSLLLNATAPNFGAMYVMLKGFHERMRPELSGPAIADRLQSQFQNEIQEGIINVFGAPPVEGLGTAGGIKIVVEDRGATGLENLQGTADRIVQEGNTDPRLTGVFTSFRANTPWLFLNIDRTQAKTMGVSMTDVFDTLQVYLGSLYVNDFNKFGRTWQVNVQGDAQFRKQIDDLKQLKIRNNQPPPNNMVPLGTLATAQYVNGPVMVVRYNMYPAAAINANAGPGVSSGQAITELEQVVQPQLAPSMRPEWTELALLQLQTGNTALIVFVLAVVLVFLVLAAQYESWSLPLAVILVVPMCLLCSIVGVTIGRMDINIFTQIGFVVLVGLACKNAILIVEYAKAQREAGVPRFEATLEACKLRLRPIIMTSFAFILGVVPLVIATGAGAEMRQTLGTAVFSGMLGVTLFGIFLTPVFFYVIQWITDRRGRGRTAPEAVPAETPTDAATAVTAKPH
ncbi:MAG: efflux RND transporter permease subunit, partial [Planctomycetes bacterium]|nr:efflux RND transporter permease subunit [Planctomycetota bacterium]